MKVLFVLFVIGCLQPSNPDYANYLAELGGIPISTKLEIFDSEAACNRKRIQYLETAPMHQIVVTFHECISVTVSP